MTHCRNANLSHCAYFTHDPTVKPQPFPPHPLPPSSPHFPGPFCNALGGGGPGWCGGGVLGRGGGRGTALQAAFSNCKLQSFAEESYQAMLYGVATLKVIKGAFNALSKGSGALKKSEEKLSPPSGAPPEELYDRKKILLGRETNIAAFLCFRSRSLFETLSCLSACSSGRPVLHADSVLCHYLCTHHRQYLMFLLEQLIQGPRPPTKYLDFALLSVSSGNTETILQKTTEVH